MKLNCLLFYSDHHNSYHPIGTSERCPLIWSMFSLLVVTFSGCSSHSTIPDQSMYSTGNIISFYSDSGETKIDRIYDKFCIDSFLRFVVIHYMFERKCVPNFEKVLLVFRLGGLTKLLQ